MKFEIWKFELRKSKGSSEGKKDEEEMIKSKESPNFTKMKKILGFELVLDIW